MNCAPILISVYDRLEHFKSCIESLKQNLEAKDTILYIASDYWGKGEDEPKVLAVRSYIFQINGFKEVIPLFNEVNYGAHESICNAINVVLSKHESIIFMEDDIVVSPFFLDYMNSGLLQYQDRKDVFGICGFIYNDLKIPSDYPFETFLWSRNAPWGFATWKDRWNSLDLELSDFDSFIKDKKAVRKFKRIAPATWNVLINDRKGIIKALDVRISFNMFMHNQVSVFPVKTLTMNKGFDGSGVNCGEDRRIQNRNLCNTLCDCPIKHDLNVKKDKRIYRAERIMRTSIIDDYLRPALKDTIIGDLWRWLNGKNK